MRVLLLDDDVELRGSLADILRSQAIAVDEVGTLADADERLHVNDYDVAVLDRGLPDGDAVALLRDIRAAGIAVPVLFLTALDEISDRVTGLDSGGDDYLVKPFAVPELLARIRSLGRRPSVTPQPELRLGDLVVDPSRVTAHRAGRAVALTPKEFALLAYLVQHRGRVISRTELLEHCWDEFAEPTSNVIDVRMRLLRQKLGEPALIHTVRSAGYLADTSESSP